MPRKKTKTKAKRKPSAHRFDSIQELTVTLVTKDSKGKTTPHTIRWKAGKHVSLTVNMEQRAPVRRNWTFPISGKPNDLDWSGVQHLILNATLVDHRQTAKVLGWEEV